MNVTPPEIFEEMPAGFRSYLKRGFSSLARLHFDKVEQLSTLVANGLEQSDETTSTDRAKLLGVSKEEVPTIVAALGLLIAFTTRRTDVEAVLQHAVHAGAIENDDVRSLLFLASRLSENKNDYKEALEIASLAKEVAPSFDRLHIAVELRFAFEGIVPIRSVPVVLCHLSTDSDDADSFFQMRRSDLVRVIEQLSKALQQVDVLQKQSTL